GAGQDEALRRAERFLRDEVPRLEEASRRLSEQAAALEELARQLEERTRGEMRTLLGEDLLERHRVLGRVDRARLAEIARNVAPAAPPAPPAGPASAIPPTRAASAVPPAVPDEATPGPAPPAAPGEAYRRARSSLLRAQSRKAADEAARLRALAEATPGLAPEPGPPPSGPPREGGPRGGVPGLPPATPAPPGLATSPLLPEERLRSNEEEIRLLREEIERLRRELARVRPTKEPI
ncbi:MAG: hypothetical protein L0323_12390, partial [Planctomycetes bacterium]|nr:hypothetical protein [Planctomycetota bacterium]